MHVIGITYGILTDHQKYKNVRFEEKSVSTGSYYNSLSLLLTATEIGLWKRHNYERDINIILCRVYDEKMIIIKKRKSAHGHEK